jgi:hypothetical protein
MRKKITILLISLYCSGLFLSGQSINHWETVIFNTDNWKYRAGTSEPDPDWRLLTYDDSLWPDGPGGFGYGDNDDNTVIPQCFSVCLRIKFNISDTAELISAILHMDYDDGFIAYLNDTEIVRIGVQGIHPPYDQLAGNHEAAMYNGEPPESFFLNKKKLRSILLPGENILAIEVHNDSGTSDDLSSNAWLSFGIAGTSYLFRQVPDWFTPVSEFTSSDLPVVVINTQAGEDIMDEPKITADMKIIYNGKGQVNNVSDPGNVYTGKVGIEIRGRYSANLPQKPYGFETRDEAGNNLNIPILEMPEENDWILTANYNDKAFLRNYLAFEIFRKMGHYAPRTVYCEAVINEQYQGIYLLGEKIKRDKNRVDIAKLNPDENSGDDLTGGYIFVNDYYTEYDSWLSNYSPLNRPDGDVHFVYYDPKPDELTITQKVYLKDFVDSFENILYSSEFSDHSKGYRAYLDVNSFADYFIIGELSRNVDAYKKSRFYYKDKDSNGGLICSGPPWDFDWAWKDITEDCIHFNQTDGSGWAYRVNDCIDWPIPPSWEIRLLQDDEFANKIYDRYFMLRKTILGEIYLNHVIDSVATILNEAQERHYQKWKILGINVGTGEYGEQPDTFIGEIEKFKSWIARRLTWLDANMIGKPSSADEENSAIFRIFPNPSENILHVESDEIISRITIFNLTGNSILDKADIGDYTTSVDITQFKPGLYIIKIYLGSGEVVSQRFVKK